VPVQGCTLPYVLYRASVPVQGCTLPFFLSVVRVKHRTGKNVYLYVMIKITNFLIFTLLVYLVDTFIKNADIININSDKGSTWIFIYVLFQRKVSRYNFSALSFYIISVPCFLLCPLEIELYWKILRDWTLPGIRLYSV
jgi:hypothetical protein